METGINNCNDHDVLIQVNERLLAFTTKFDEFVVIIRESNTTLRSEYTRNYEENARNLKETKELYAKDMSALWIDVNKLKDQTAQARGAVGLLYVISLIALIYSIIK